MIVINQLWGFLMSKNRKRAVMVKLNAETDFVAKGDAFQDFLSNTLKLLLVKDVDVNLEKDDASIESLLNDLKYDSSNSIEEARKLLIAKTKEKVQFDQISSIKGN